jgi:S1-C subfamily serine protease
MTTGTRWALVAVFLGGGIAAGMGLAKSFDLRAGAAAPAARAPLAEPPAALVSLQDSFAQVAEAVSPSVVHVTVEGADLLRPESIGSGVVVSEEGYVITNNHVVEAAGAGRSLRVRFVDGKEFPAKTLGTDLETDLALLKLDVPSGVPITPAAFADSDRVRVGDWCLAIGSPFGYRHSVTAGIVSAKHRQAGMSQVYQDFIQTDAAINPGNSGGALVNIRGEVIGINTAIVTESQGNDGVGLAIPSNLVRAVSDALRKDGRVLRGYLGVRSVDLDSRLMEALRVEAGVKNPEEMLRYLGLKEPRGTYIVHVEENSPAAKAGVKEHDVLLELDGRRVTSQSDLLFRMAAIKPGTVVPLKLIRGGQEREVKATVDARPPMDIRRRRR